MVRNRDEAVKAALATEHNIPDGCQVTTRGWFDVPSVGDYDGDGRADAEDGWKSEPDKWKHVGDRNPPKGVPVSYLGGSHGDGHRAESLGNGKIRSTDANGMGNTATVDLDWPEKVWGLKYVGWSESCDGVLIPEPAPTRVQKFLEGGPQWDVNILDRAIKNGRKGTVQRVVEGFDHQVNRLPGDEPHDTRVDQFVKIYKARRVLHMGLLNAAVDNGRVGLVKQVRDQIRNLISQLDGIDD